MTTTSSFQLTGFKELEQLLKQLPDEIAAKVLSKAFQQGAVVVRDAAKDNAPVGKTGSLKKSIKIVKPSKKVSPKASLVLIVRCKNALSHIVEYGTGPRTRESGGSTGSMPAHPFMRPAIDSHAEAAIARIKNVCSALIDHVSVDLAKRLKSIK